MQGLFNWEMTLMKWVLLKKDVFDMSFLFLSVEVLLFLISIWKVSHTPLLMNNIFSLLSVSFKCCSISTVIEVKGNIITDFHVKGAAVQESIYLRRQLKAEDMCMSMLSAFLVRENQSGLDILGGKSFPIDFDLFPLHLIPKSWWNGNSICSWDIAVSVILDLIQPCWIIEKASDDFSSCVSCVFIHIQKHLNKFQGMCFLYLQDITSETLFTKAGGTGPSVTSWEKKHKWKPKIKKKCNFHIIAKLWRKAYISFLLSFEWLIWFTLNKSSGIYRKVFCNLTETLLGTTPYSTKTL